MRDVLVKVLEMKSRKHWLDSDLETILIHVTEQPIERPTTRIASLLQRYAKIVCDKGSVNYLFSTVINFNRAVAPEIEKLADSGYQGIAVLYANSYPSAIQNTRNKPLTRQTREFNRELASRRMPIEPVNRWCKIFPIITETYRGKHRNDGKT